MPGQLTRISGALARALNPFSKASPGSGGFYLPITGGWLPPDAPWNFFQTGMSPVPIGGSAVVTACIAAYAQTAATCPGTHWRRLDNGGRERVTNSALARILKVPNDYQTSSDFILNLVTSLYADGNAYVLGLRNNRFEFGELHIMRPTSSWPRVAENGDLYYSLSGNLVVDRLVEPEMLSAVPSRHVMHVKLNVNPANPLVGVPPLTAAALDVAASDSLVRQALAYAQNEGRPSGVITTDQQLSEQLIRQTRAKWDELTRGPNAGGTPILTRGLKWQSVTTSSRDAQIAERLQYSDQRIATVFRIPLALLSLVTGQVPSSSTEQLLRFWIATSFGFLLRHIEENFSTFFQLAGWPDEYVEFDTAALERSNQLDRIEALARAVQGGIYSPNEARALEDLPAAEAGDEPRVQQQVVPLSFGAKPPAPPAAPPGNGDTGDSEGASDAGDTADATAAFSAAVLRSAREHGRRAA